MKQTIQQKVRPWVTLSMTFVFCVLILGAAVGVFADRWPNILTAFLGVYGPVLGVWFGERAALKVPGKEEQPDVVPPQIVPNPFTPAPVPPEPDINIYPPKIDPATYTQDLVRHDLPGDGPVG